MDSLKETNAKTRRAYNLVARKYHELFHDELKEKAYDRELLDGFAGRLPKGAFVCDAGCGPSGHIGRYLTDKGVRVVGVDVSDRCVELARKHNPGMRFERQDIGAMTFASGSFDGVVAYYSIIDTPKRHMERIFREFQRVLKPAGALLVVVKAGTEEGYIYDLLGLKTEIYFTLFSEKEIGDYFTKCGFRLDFLDRRDPYGFEIQSERIFAIGIKV